MRLVHVIINVNYLNFHSKILGFAWPRTEKIDSKKRRMNV